MKTGQLKIGLLVLMTLLFVGSGRSQVVDNKLITWEDKLHEKSVDYGAFACKDVEAKIVNDFFKNRSLNRRLPVCHNNCPVMTAFSSRPLPPTDAKLKGNGFIAIHVAVNEDGAPIYARALNGHPVMRSMAEIRSCEATFMPSETKRQRVIFFCVNGNCDEPQPVL